MIASQALNTRQQSVSQTVPSPVGGLNGRDPLAQMAKTDAYLLDNWFPGTASLDSRQGCTEFAATVNNPIQSLEVYSGGAGDVLLSFAGGKVYNVSTGIPAQLATGHNSDIVVSAMFSNAADTAQHLIMTTGVDTPFRFDGATIANLVITGMTGLSSTLNSVFAFKGRLYFGQKDKLGFYYLPVGVIQGALSFFDLAQISKLGGYLVAMASFSAESGNGPSDYMVFITSKGECIVYAGYDPAVAANWSLVGRYFAAVPIGKKCTVNYGSELVLLTLEGAIPFSQIKQAGDELSRGVPGAQYSALTSKLGKILSNLNVNADVPGWEAIQYAKGGWLLLNVPATSSIAGDYNHYVMNTTTNAWTRFTDWNGLCFAVFSRRLYFGTYDGRVMLADDGYTDDGEPIKLQAKQAYNYFEDGSGIGMLHKHFQWATLLVGCNGSPPLSAKYNVDFVENVPTYVTDVVNTQGSEWDTSDWDVADWGADLATQRFVTTLNNEGVAGSLWLRAFLDDISLSWYATQYVFVKTRGLLP